MSARVIVTGAAGGIGATRRAGGWSLVASALAHVALPFAPAYCMTTRRGALGYVLLRHMPRRLLDAVVRRRLTRRFPEGVSSHRLA